MRKTMMQICAAVAAVFIVVKQAQAAGPLSSIDDVRVGPLLTTSWAQGSVGDKPCYNYYTPLNRVCGCTATAVGQIMYYHRYPTTRILPGETLYDTIDEYGSYSIGTDGNGGMTKSSDGTYTAFDPPYGGPYNWNLMVASPTSATSENSRKAIGQLTRDAGFAVFSHYYTGETSGYTAAVASSIILNLHYADAVRTGFDLNKLIANLDAGLPVEVGITSHAVVADGYGYHNGTLYIHINYGHGGSNSGWYDPTSTIGSGDRSLQDMVANIFPPSRGARHSSVISGRVLDANGAPVANATVTASADGLSTVTTNSNAHGVYAFILPAGDYTFAVSKSGAVGSRAYTVAASSQKTRAEGDGWGNGVNNSASGIDVTLYSESDFAKSWRNNAGDGRFDNAQNWTGNTLPSSGQDVAVFVSGDTLITASSAMTVGTVSVPSGTVRFSGSGAVITLGGVNLLSAASTVEITGREGLSNTSIAGVGTLEINPGAGNTYTMPNNNTNFTGLAVVKSGTVKFGDSRSFGAQPSNIRVKGGATLDENNVSQGGYSGQKNYLTLEEGATLAASSGDVTTGSPLTKMKLEGNATVDATSGTVSIADGFDYLKMEIKLGANTLTKIGSKDFYISCCEISGTGLFDVTEGRVVMAPMYFTDNSPASCSEGTMRIRSGASIHVNDNNNKVMVLTVKDLILDGSVTKGNCNHVLTVTDSISGKGTTPMLTLGSGAVFKPTGTGYLTVTESLSGTFRLDMSGVDLSSTNEVPLVSVPAALAESVRFDSTTIPAGWSAQPVPENGNVRYVLTDDDHFTEREMFHTDLLGRFAKRAQDFDVGDYVQTGLIAHFDGIRNAGADLPHDPTTRTWKNLVSGGSDATFEGAGGNWNAAGNGFVFDGSSVMAHTDSPGIHININNSTIQIACDVDYTQQTNGGDWYPGMFVMTDYDYGIYINNTGAKSNVLNYKSWPMSNETGGRPTINPWDGMYVTAAFDGNMQYLVQGTALVNGVARSAYWDGGNMRYSWGGKSGSSTRYVKGTYHSVRIYNATLTEDQLAQNRFVDEIRFRGGFTASDVDIVIATGTPGLEGVEPCGEYMVNGNHTFSARDVMFNGNFWTPVGYTLEKWDVDSGTWTHFVDSEASSFAYTNCVQNGKMRLTWLWSETEKRSMTLRVAGYTGSSTLTNFQALVKLSDNDDYGFSYADCAAADGSDLWFEDAEGNLIPHDIDTWNTSGDSYVWVKIPLLTRNTKIVMCWGAPRSAAQTCTPSDTWSGYVGVWHMNKTGTTAEPNSTANSGLDAAPKNTSGDTSINTATGTVGAGRAISADGTYFTVGSSASKYHTPLTTKANFSVSGWFKLSSVPSNNAYQRMICGMSSSSLNAWELFRQDGSNVGVRSGNGSQNTSAFDLKVSIGAGSTWHYLTAVWNGKNCTVYENGSSVGTKGLTYDNTHMNDVFTIGGRIGTGNRSFVGTFDEVRMYNGVLNADRIAADYATMSSPTTFLKPFTTQSEQFYVESLGCFAKRAEDFDVGDYVQTGLIAHYDGIRNAGADLPHDPSIRTWKNLVSGGPDASFVGDGGEWNAAGNGFVFDGRTVRADMDSPGIDMNHVNSTVQIACDVDYNQQSYGDGWYPGIFVMTDEDYGIFFRNNYGRSNALEYKPAPYSNDDGGQRPKIEPWSGKYVTAAFDGYRQYLVEGTSLGEGKPRSSYSDRAAKRFAWGGNPSGSTRYVKGTYHSVRIYNATLTDDELYWNRIVDEARFRGSFDSVVGYDIVIATSEDGVEGVEPCGEYLVNGSHTFSATKRVVNGRTMMPAGYTLEKWDADAGEWRFHAASDATSFNYVNSIANGRMRLTWNWKKTPLAIILR